ncbi:TetR/AcrR family transcriptional regulator [Nannocystaceae bacterium ST9]
MSKPTKKKAALSESRPPRARSGPKPALSTDAIVRAAIEIADAQGLEGVTMQRLGDVFGFTAMSMYRYVRDKDELVAAMIDAALGPAPKLDGELAWRLRLEHWAGQVLRRFVLHPWTLAATGHLRTMGPNELAWLDRALSALAMAGLEPVDQHAAFLVLIGHVRSVAQFSVRAPSAPRGVTLADWREHARANSEGLAALGAAFRAGGFRQRANASALDEGLRIVLDGIEVASARRTSRAHSAQ